MNNNTKISLSFPKKFNRCNTYMTYVSNKKILFNILFNNKKTSLQFKTYKEPNDISITLFRNLELSKFCKMFLTLNTIKEEKVDYINKFLGINRSYERKLNKFLVERTYIENCKMKSSNYLLVIGFKLIGYECDFNFFFVQRKCYNSVTKTNIIRTSGIQISNSVGDNILDKLYNNYTEEYEELSNITFLKNNIIAKVKEHVEF